MPGVFFPNTKHSMQALKPDMYIFIDHRLTVVVLNCKGTEKTAARVACRLFGDLVSIGFPLT